MCKVSAQTTHSSIVGEVSVSRHNLQACFVSAPQLHPTCPPTAGVLCKRAPTASQLPSNYPLTAGVLCKRASQLPPNCRRALSARAPTASHLPLTAGVLCKRASQLPPNCRRALSARAPTASHLPLTAGVLCPRAPNCRRAL